MRVQGKSERIAWKYLQPVAIPAAYRALFWDHPEGTVPLEKLILRLFTYGHFEDIRWLYQTYPEESWEIAHRYPDIKRGIKFWLKRWKDERDLS